MTKMVSSFDVALYLRVCRPVIVSASVYPDGSWSAISNSTAQPVLVSIYQSNWPLPTLSKRVTTLSS
ncbi:hypothetical protein JKP21_09020 [Vibrio vulnificus]|nr:hypothetical protein [Vibrio vulnificus]